MKTVLAISLFAVMSFLGPAFSMPVAEVSYTFTTIDDPAARNLHDSAFAPRGRNPEHRSWDQ